MTQPTNSPSQLNCADWMKQAAALAPTVNDTPLCRLPLPGSHDAGSYGGINVKSKTQQKSILEQLQAGVRYFDLRVRVDNGVFFSHHGADESRDNRYTEKTLDSTAHYVFADIAQFCQEHDGEIVILNFQDFTAVWNQSFNDRDDAPTFINCIKRDFHGLLAPRDSLLTSGPLRIPTYGECIKRGQRVVVVFNDGGNPALQDSWIWPWSHCLRDRFSDYKYALHTWGTLVNGTLSDQEEYLAKTTSDSRDLDYFWVSQAILGYTNMTTPGGESQNKEGAQRLNPVFTKAFKQWWTGQSAISGLTQTVQQPNILLLDYSGVFDDFAADCFNLLTGQSAAPIIS